MEYIFLINEDGAELQEAINRAARDADWYLMEGGIKQGTYDYGTKDDVRHFWYATLEREGRGLHVVGEEELARIAGGLD